MKKKKIRPDEVFRERLTDHTTCKNIVMYVTSSTMLPQPGLFLKRQSARGTDGKGRVGRKSDKRTFQKNYYLETI